MLERIAKAFTYYNECYASQVIVFRCKDKYYLCNGGSDISRLVKAIEAETFMVPCKAKDTVLCHVHVINVSIENKFLDILIQHGVRFKMVTFRNNFKEFDIPDIDLIEQEMEDDY